MTCVEFFQDIIIMFFVCLFFGNVLLAVLGTCEHVGFCLPAPGECRLSVPSVAGGRILTAVRPTGVMTRPLAELTNQETALNSMAPHPRHC